VATPVLLRHIEFGTDIVVLSLTICMGGHGTPPPQGGAIIDSGDFPWANSLKRFPGPATLRRQLEQAA
jgi:O-acetylhomoserine (thiol)-lyase